MAYPIPSKCSVCGGELMVTRLTCANCQTELNGSFAPCKYCALNEKQRVFMETFLKCRGNIKEAERVLSLSYPTVKGLLDDLLASLFPQETVSRPDRMEILDMLEKKLISVDEAAKLLRGEA